MICLTKSERTAKFVVSEIGVVFADVIDREIKLEQDAADALYLALRDGDVRLTVRKMFEVESAVEALFPALSKKFREPWVWEIPGCSVVGCPHCRNAN